MKAIPEHYVSIQVHMPAEVLEDLRTAARRSGMSIEDWLTWLLARGAAPELLRRQV